MDFHFLLFNLASCFFLLIYSLDTTFIVFYVSLISVINIFHSLKLRLLFLRAIIISWGSYYWAFVFLNFLPLNSFRNFTMLNLSNGTDNITYKTVF